MPNAGVEGVQNNKDGCPDSKEDKLTQVMLDEPTEQNMMKTDSLFSVFSQAPRPTPQPLTQT